MIRARRFERFPCHPRLDTQFRAAARDIRQRAHVGRDYGVLLGRARLSDLVARLHGSARRYVHAADLDGIGKRNDVPRRRDSAGAAEEDEGRAEINDEEAKYAEHARCISHAHESAGGAAAALDRVGNVRVEAIDDDVHETGAPISSSKSARRTRGGTKSSRSDAAKRISAE